MYKGQFVKGWYWVGLTLDRDCRSREEGSSRLLVWKGYTDVKGSRMPRRLIFLVGNCVWEDFYEPGIGTKQ